LAVRSGRGKRPRKKRTTGHAEDVIAPLPSGASPDHFAGKRRESRPAVIFLDAMNIYLLAAGLLYSSLAFAQKTVTEIAKPTTPEDDAKPNSEKVPEGYAMSGQFKRVVVLRFKYQADLLAGLDKMVKEQKIKNAVFLSGIGSLRNYHIHSVSNRTFPSKNVFTKDPTAPADIVSINGYVIDGRIHAHMTLTNEQNAFGGHIEPNNSVFTFAIVTLGVFDDSVDLSKVDDKTYR
jgi:predicted DNA-binding protein with PD1-like motif